IDDIHPALAVALVGVVIAGEEIAVFVESKFLRIAQTARDDFHVGAVWLAAEDGAFVRKGEDLAFLRGDVCTTVAKGEVEAAIRSENEPVHVVPRVGETHAIPEGERFALLGLALGSDARE